MNRYIRYIIFTLCFLMAAMVHAQVTVPKRDIQAVDSLNRTKPIAPLTVEKNGYSLNSGEDGKYYHRKTIPYWQDSLGVTLLDTTYIDGSTLIMVTMAGDSLIYGGGNDSVEFEGDTVCIIDMGEEFCVSIDSIFFTDTSLCYIILPDTSCVEWSNTGINIYVSDGSLTGTRTLTQNGYSLTWEGSVAGRTRWSGTNASPGEYMELSHTNVSPHRALLSLQHRTSGTSNDAFMRYGVSGSGGAYPYFSTGLDRSERAFAISDSNTLGLNHLLRIYSPVGTDNDSIVLYRNTSIYPGLGINRRPQKALDVIGMVNIKETTASQNLFINGGRSGAATDGGVGNIVLGNNTAGDAITSGDNNIVMGLQAASSLNTGGGNVVLGTIAGNALTSGGANVLIGTGAGPFVSTGDNNIAIGTNAMWANGARNIFLGNASGQGSSQDSNVVIGYRALISSIGGTRKDNVILGYRAADGIQAGDGMVIIGAHAAQGWGNTPTSQLIIDNSSTTTPLIHGNFSTDTVHINGTFRANIFRWTVVKDSTNTTVTLTTASKNGLTMKLAGAKTVNLPDASGLGLPPTTIGFTYYICNRSSSGDITVAAPGTGDTLSGDVVLSPGESRIWTCMDADYWDAN